MVIPGVLLGTAVIPKFRSERYMYVAGEFGLVEVQDCSCCLK